MNEFSAKQVIVSRHLINYFSSIEDNSKLNVVFIHGWLSNANVWFHLMHALKKVGISSYALDLPGFGASQIPQDSVDNNFYVKVVEEFISKLNLTNVILVGHSNGGAIATKFVTQNSSVKSLVLIDAAGIRLNTVSKKVKVVLAKLVKPLFKIPLLQPLRLKIYTSMGSEDYINSEYLNNTYKNIIDEDISNLYNQVTIPTLIVWGKNDLSTPLAFGEFINHNIKNSQLKIIDAGHFPFVDKPDQVINYLVNFLQ